MLTVQAARERVLTAIEPLSPVDVPVGDALGLVLARDVVAPEALPRFSNSAMDGYAVRADDVVMASENEPVELSVVGEVRAGSPGDVEVAPRTSVRIMTGAPIPPGADAIVPVELTSEHDGRIRIVESVAVGRHVRPAGEDVAEGGVLVRAGTELSPGELAVLAAAGASPLPLRRGPRVAVLVTGDELVPPEASPGAGQIRDSNSIALRTLVAQAGGEPLPFPVVEDDRQAVREALGRAADLADLIVTSGGVSVGGYDFIKEIVEELGSIELWRVAMQPGKPVVLGRVGSRPLLGLPGNPVSVHVAFEQFVRPAIRKLRGCRSLLRPTVAARLTETVRKPPGRLHFVRVRLDASGEEWTATPTGPQGSHIQSSLVECHGVARFGVDETNLDEGSTVVVEVWTLPEGVE
jgi:molybdopterin molybdotransferase